ncbi:MAG: hypothetical protein AB2L24_04870 [Mangrovibacterium sp.]
MDERKGAEHFLELIKKSRRGKFKVYIGMSAGVGKTYRMLQEAHVLLRNGIDVKLGVYRNPWAGRSGRIASGPTGYTQEENLLQKPRGRRDGSAGHSEFEAGDRDRR